MMTKSRHSSADSSSGIVYHVTLADQGYGHCWKKAHMYLGMRLKRKFLIACTLILTGLLVFVYFISLVWITQHRPTLHVTPQLIASPVPFPMFMSYAFDEMENKSAKSSVSGNKNGENRKYEFNYSLLPSSGINTNLHCLPFPMRFDQTFALFNCSWDSEPNPNCEQRLRAFISCNASFANIVYKWVKFDTPPSMHQYEETCLDNVIKEKCYDQNSIPRVMHFISFGRLEFPFYAMLSVLSAVRFVQPCLILFHGDYLPHGHYWDLLVQRVPNILHINRSAPISIFGHVVKQVEHSADIARLEAMRRFGGIYMDYDHILLNSLDNLRNYSVVMGIETDGLNLGNGMFLASPGAKFLDLWYDSYQSFNDEEWGVHSTIMPYKLNHIFPKLNVHVLDVLFKPTNRMLLYEMYTRMYNWTNLYGVHLYSRYSKRYMSRKLESLDSSMGEMTRRILYGDSQACFAKEWCFGKCSYDSFVDIVVYITVTMFVIMCMVCM